MVGGVRVTEDELKAEAAKFKRAKAAEKKRRQRNGGYVLPVEVHLPTLARMLLAEGLLKEGELDDVDAISAATAAHLRKHQHVGRILEDRTARYSYVRYERDAEYEAREKKRAKRLDEQGPGSEYYYGPHVPIECQGDRRGQSGLNPAGKRVQYLRNMNIEKRGVKIGRARIGTPLPGQEAKKIKPLTAKKVRAAVEKIEKKHGPLVAPDTGVHTVATAEGEIDQREWEKLGYAKRAAPPVTDSDKDDPGSWS
jgi:hypothetical protein